MSHLHLACVIFHENETLEGPLCVGVQQITEKESVLPTVLQLRQAGVGWGRVCGSDPP